MRHLHNRLFRALFPALLLGCIVLSPAAQAFDSANLPPDLKAAIEGGAVAPAASDSDAEQSQAAQLQMQAQPQATDPAQVVVRPLAPPIQPGDMFGSQLFNGNFAARPSLGFNPEYRISIGDKILLRLWGAFDYSGTIQVDVQGNIFIPNVGPVPVVGVANGKLNDIVVEAVRKVYRSNVRVYATLEAARPVKVFVSGYVTNPGLYGGLSSDSILSYLDKAGGVDPKRGSYIDVRVLRNGQIRRKYNLYDFLLHGKLELVQLADGDTIFVGPRKHVVTVTGEVYNPYKFEFSQEVVPLTQVMQYARPKPNATNVSIVHHQGRKATSDYRPLKDIVGVMVEDGDELSVQADKYPGTILVRVQGMHNGEHALVLPFGAKLKDALAQIVPNQRSDMSAIQLFRPSLAKRQKELLDKSLDTLEQQALTARSATREEALLRAQEAKLISEFVAKARNIQPKGQVVLNNPQTVAQTLLEDGDILVIPEKTSLVTVNGEVIFPTAMLYHEHWDYEDYIDSAGGFTQSADSSRVVVIHPNGASETAGWRTELQAGDDLIVLPEVDSKNLEIGKAITQILYQIAIAARVALQL